MKLTGYKFPQTQYILREYDKTQIYLHHTAGNSDPFGVYQDWETTEARIATCVVVGGKPKPGSNWIDGEVVNGFESKYWAWHLGLKEYVFEKFNLPYIDLDEISIGIEICNWGQLTYKNGKYYNYVNKEVPLNEVCILENKHKGYKFYHKITTAQIDAVAELLLLFEKQYGIPITYYDDIWDLCPRALSGEPGVYTHNSVRSDKVDVSPQPELIEVLKSL